MVDGDSMGPGLQLIRARFLNSFQESYHLSSNFAKCRYFRNFKWPYFRSASCYSYTVGHAGSPTRTVYADVTCDLDPIQGQGHGAFELPKIAHNCTLLRLSPTPLSRGAQN